MKSINIKINNKEVVIKKLPLGKYAEVLNAFDKLPAKIGSFDKLSQDKILEVLPKLISESFPELIKIISIASDVKEEELTNEYGLDDVTLLIKGIFDVNDFALVKKNIQGLLKQKAVAKKVDTGLKK